MRSHERALEERGEGAGDTGADHHGRNDVCGVRSCERDGTFGDEGKTHDIVGRSGGAFLSRELLREELAGHRDGDRGNHAADHDAGHHQVTGIRAEGQHADTEEVSSLVDRAAHIGGHHEAEQETEKNDEVLGVQEVQEGGDGVVQPDHDRVDGTHDHGDERNADQRIDEHRTDTIQGRRELGGEFLQPVDDETGNETGEQGAKETGGDVLAAGSSPGCADLGEVTADETDCEAGPVSNGHGDETGKDGKHEAECRAADGVEPGGEGGHAAEVGAVRQAVACAVNGVEQEGQGDEDTAANDERKHVGNTVHEVFVDLSPGALVIGRCIFRNGTGLCFVDRSRTAGGLGDEFFCFVDAVCDRDFDERFAVEAGHFDILVGRDDDAVSTGDLFRGQDVLGTAGAVGFDFDRDAHLCALLLEGFGCHVGMRDTGRAGRDSDDAGAFCCGSCSSCGGTGGCGGSDSGDLFLRCRLFFRIFRVFLFVDDVKELFRGLGSAKGGTEVRVHEHDHQSGEDLQVSVAGAFRSGDHERERCRLTVGSVIVDAVRDGDGGKAGLFGGSGLGVRDGKAFADGGGALRLTFQDGSFVAGHVSQIAHLVVERNELVDGSFLVSCADAEFDGFHFEQISDSHSSLPSFLNQWIP